MSSIVGELVIAAIILWMVFRVVRKAGYHKGRAWGLVGISLLLTVAGHWLEYLISSSLDLVGHALILNFGELAILTTMHVIFSPCTLTVLPLLYYSFRKWPVETHASDADVFG
jgi:hypothetical protein